MADIYHFVYSLYSFLYDFLLENKWVLWGHQILPFGVVRNILFPLQTLQFLSFYRKVQKDDHPLWMAFWFGLFMLWLPNSTYLFLELKHVLFVDNIADNGDPLGTLFFIFLSIAGLLLTVYTIRKAVREIDILGNPPRLSIVFLCIMSAIGASIGIQDVLSYELFFSYEKVIFQGFGAITTVPWVLFIAGLSTFISFVCLKSRDIY